jgi:hypothetical protein
MAKFPRKRAGIFVTVARRDNVLLRSSGGDQRATLMYWARIANRNAPKTTRTTARAHENFHVLRCFQSTDLRESAKLLPRSKCQWRERRHRKTDSVRQKAARDEESERLTNELLRLDEHENPSPEEKALAEFLTMLIDEYEERRYPIRKASPQRTLQHLMEART